MSCRHDDRKIGGPLLWSLDGDKASLLIDGREVLVASYHMDNLSPEIADNQKRVFIHFGIPLRRFVGKLPHGEALDAVLNLDYAFTVLFDVDCVPLREDVIHTTVDAVWDEDSLYGAEQCCVSRRPNSFYVAPSFMCVPNALWRKLHRPSMRDSSEFDVGQRLTDYCVAAGKEIRYVRLDKAVKPKWRLPDGRMFGEGSEYGGLVYHQFEIRHERNHEAFIKKCDEIIGG